MFIILTFTLFLFSCQNTERVDLTFHLLPTSMDWVPYQVNHQIIFEDSQKNKCFCDLKTGTFQYIEKTQPIIVNDLKSNVNYEYFITEETHSWYLDCSQLNLEFCVRLNVNPYKTSITDKMVQDQLLILLVERDQKKLGEKYHRSETVVFSLIADSRNYPIPTESSSIGSDTLNNKPYKDIYQSAGTNPYEILYTKEHGIISFNDKTGNKWYYSGFVEGQ